MVSELSFEGLLTPAEARKLLDVSPSRVHQYAREGRLTPVQTPLGKLYRAEDVLRLARWRRERREGRAA